MTEVLVVHQSGISGLLTWASMVKCASLKLWKHAELEIRVLERGAL